MFFQKLPSIRLIMLVILLIQICVAASIFLLKQASALSEQFETQYLTKEIDYLSTEEQTTEFKKKAIPVLKDDQDHPSEFSLPAEFSERAKFEIILLKELGKGVLLSGPIRSGDKARLVTFLEQEGRHASFVSLHSPGGNVNEAHAIGRELRARRLATVLSSKASCLSACPYIMAGGVDRYISEYSLLGVHRHYYSDNLYIPIYFAVEDIQKSQAATFKYLKEMGILIDVMEHILSTPSDEIYILNTKELIEYKFVTKPFSFTKDST
jgi:hypothetical protein